jgi:DNA (cytosine-5)-methyltransferase 1
LRRSGWGRRGGVLTIPVIDLFAGPGGLGEGFSAFQPGSTPADGVNATSRLRPAVAVGAFRIALSIEKDPSAWQTLRLRSFFRQFERDEVPGLYYELLRGEFSLAEFPERLQAGSKDWFGAWERASEEARQFELGASDSDHRDLSERIDRAVRGSAGRWVLIGGPPCQAYSVVGRSRNKGKVGYQIETDHRSSLYKQYLRIIADHWPAVFVMENVKGMLSAKLDGRPVFARILEDLERPRRAMGLDDGDEARYQYRILPIVTTDATLQPDEFEPRDFIVESEKYGIPQTRHRVILVGIRRDLGEVELPRLTPSPAPTVRQVIGGMPRLRSGVSRTATTDGFAKVRDSREEWIETIARQVLPEPGCLTRLWVESIRHLCDGRVVATILNAVEKIQDAKLSLGGPFVPCKSERPEKNPLSNWLFDEHLRGVCNHESRLHLDKDLPRYLFAAAYAAECGESPRLDVFPPKLQPRHENAATGHFDDRFRVQLADRPSTTITSHISKDGHYFIHYDPSQCRSLTVREAARLQTFPDNYFFCGPRTHQYVQVGNAVPPLLARRQYSNCSWRMRVNSTQCVQA